MLISKGMDNSKSMEASFANQHTPHKLFKLLIYKISAASFIACLFVKGAKVL